MGTAPTHMGLPVYSLHETRGGVQSTVYMKQNRATWTINSNNNKALKAIQCNMYQHYAMEETMEKKSRRSPYRNSTHTATGLKTKMSAFL